MSDIGPDNFRECAEKALKRYDANGMIVDVLVWGRVVALYEAEIVAYQRIREALVDRIDRELSYDCQCGIGGPDPRCSCATSQARAVEMVDRIIKENEETR